MYFRSSWSQFHRRPVAFIDWVAVVLAVLVVAALDCFVDGCLAYCEADFLLLIDLLVIWGKDYLSCVCASCDGVEEL